MYQNELNTKTEESNQKSQLLYDRVWPEICQKQQETYEQSITNMYEVVQNFGIAMADHAVALQSSAIGFKLKRSSIEIRHENVQIVLDENQPVSEIELDVEERASFIEETEIPETRPTPLGSRDSKSTVSDLYLETQAENTDRHQFLPVVKDPKAEILYSFDGSTVSQACITSYYVNNFDSEHCNFSVERLTTVYTDD